MLKLLVIYAIFTAKRVWSARALPEMLQCLDMANFNILSSQVKNFSLDIVA
jgi:hypothetical protein